MENIKSAINLLEAVRSTMDTISVVGIDNQDKFVGCANAVRTVSQTLVKYLDEAEADKPDAPVTKVNREVPAVEDISTEVAGDG